MKIAYVNNHYQLGGAETVVRQLHEGALARGHDSRLHVTEGKDWPDRAGLHPLYPRLLARLELSRASGLVRRFAARRQWTDRSFRALAQGDADIVHVHSYHGLYATMESFATVARAKPLVWTFHRFWGITGGCDHPFDCDRYQSGCGSCPQVGRFAVGPVDHTAAEWSEKRRLLSPLPMHIVSPSHHLARRVRESALGRDWQVSVIPNGVEPRQFSGRRKHDGALRTSLGLSTEKTVALFTNRSFRDPIKGFPVIREALCSRTWTGLQVVLAGGESDWARSQLPAELDVVDAGYIRDRERMAAYCEASDLYLYASEGENFPCAVLEAMCAECCVVTTPVDGVLEQVEAGKSGCLAAANTGEALAACLTDALALRRETRQQLGRLARQRVEQEFSEQGMVDAHLRLYETLLAGRTP